MKLAIFVKNLLNIQIHGEEMSNLRPKIVSRALKECTKYGTPKKGYGIRCTLQGMYTFDFDSQDDLALIVRSY